MTNDPQIILADEPTSALDEETAQIVVDYFKELAGQGKTVISVTHSSEFANEHDQIFKVVNHGLVKDA